MEQTIHYNDRVLEHDVVTTETLRLNTKDELMHDPALREQWIQLLQQSERECFKRSPDMQSERGIVSNNERIRSIIEEGIDYELVAGVFQTFEGAQNHPLANATDYTVLTVQLYEERVVINEVCRVPINKTRVSPTKKLLEYVENYLRSVGVVQVSMFVEDVAPRRMRKGTKRTGMPVTVNGKTLLAIYNRYGYEFDGWLDQNEFALVKNLV